jgi:uncharacterized membrane protein YozB (DUF420 family)
MRTELTRSALYKNKRRSERLFGTGLLLIASATIFAGFARTFYLNGVFARRPLSVMVHLHGIFFSAWFILIFIQIALIARHRVDLHRRLGYGGTVLAASIVVVGYLVAIHAARYGSPTIPPGLPGFKFLAVPFFDVLVFGILAGSGLYLRRKPDVHKRLMILATLSVVTPGLARIPLEFLRHRDITTIFLMGAVLALAYIAWDTLLNKRLHPACLIGGLLLVLSIPARFAIQNTHAWEVFATWLIR